ncbi:MAG: 3-dehydroquinate synthase [Chitinivibrionales bacterium]|nr:3-dehydroquinate synthase [Chitinivibrionales bacterium]MBD3396565.1 3-dehydroquinate synthase [Chitinivibrionales bacterium]
MELTVQLGDRSYPVFLNDSRSLPDVLKSRFPDRGFALVTNTTLARLYEKKLAGLDRALGPVRHVIDDGERFKTVATWQAVLDTLLCSRLDRQAVVLAFGGGVVGDIAGFAASAFLRGVDYVQIPTTLLAMVDSSVGGKTGVDHLTGKNRIGAFCQPRMVWIDTRFLDTLPEREFVGGCAEVFKYGFIGGAEMFAFVVAGREKILGRDPALLLDAIEKSIRIKAAIVAEDERESSGKRSLLNFGHTFAHALETYYDYDKLLHGEAVLWGMACAVELGLRAGTVPAESRAEYAAFCDHLPRIQLPSRPSAGDLYAGMFADKKAAAGKIRFVLPAQPGTSVLRDDMAKADVLAAIEAVLDRTSP